MISVYSCDLDPEFYKLLVYLYILILLPKISLNSPERFHNFFFLLSTFFFLTHNTTQHPKHNKNKTTDTYSTSQSPVKREGEREGQQKHKSHSSIQSHISNKKHCQASMVEGLAPPTRAVVHSHVTICRRLRIQYVCKPVLYYCLLHSCKTSKQHSLLH